MLQKLKNKIKTKRSIFWTTEVYGRGNSYRRVTAFPDWLPLNFYSQHGVYYHNIIEEHERNNGAYFIFFFAKNLIESYNKEKRKLWPIAINIKDPFVYTRKKTLKAKTREGKGTLFFLSHSTPDSEMQLDAIELSDSLKNLDKKFQPITICFHYHDFVKKEHIKYEELGFNCIVIGGPKDNDFASKFYDKTNKFAYTASNELGSYTCYSIEMGIPFFLFGNKPLYYKPNTTLSFRNQKKDDIYVKGRELFKFSENPEINEKQKQYVADRIGLNVKFSKLIIITIAYLSLFLYIKDILIKRVKKKM